MKEKERALEKGMAGDGSFEEEGQDVETQRPLKRLRDQEGLVSPSAEGQRSPTNGVRVPVSVASTDCSTSELSISRFRGRLSSFAMEFESTTSAIEARSRKLRLEEEKVEESRKELEKAYEAARRKSKEFQAREEVFEILMKNEISERRKLAELVEQKVDKESVEVKLKYLRKRGDELEALGDYLKMKAIQVREGEEELEKKRKEVDELFEQFMSKEKKSEEQWKKFREKQAEFEVPVIGLSVKEREIGEKDVIIDMRLAELNKKEKEIDDREKRCKEAESIIEQFRSREAKFEEELAAFRQKQAELEVRVVGLTVREKVISEKEKKYRELEADTRPCSYELMEQKLEDRFNMLSKRMDELELKRVKDLESIDKNVEMMSGETLVADKRPAKSLDHLSEANIRHCGNGLEMTKKQVENTTGEIAIEAMKPAESVNRSLEVNIRFCEIANGKDLQIFMNEHANDYNSVKDEVENALKLSSDPAKLVLDAMEGFYPPHLKKGRVQFEEAVVRKNCILLLEWVTKMSPHIKPEVKREAEDLAYDWKCSMKLHVKHSLEVLAFLQLSAAFELTNEYGTSSYELVKLIGIVAHYSQAPLLLRDLGFGDEMARVIEENFLKKRKRAEAARFIAALELDSEFSSVISPEILGKESKLAPLHGNTVLSRPELQTLSSKCSGAKRSWSDACADDNHTPAHLPDSSNVTAQQPERSSNDQGCSNPISINSEEEKENKSVDSGEGKENDSEGDSFPRILSFVPLCLTEPSASLCKLVQNIEGKKLRCILIHDALRLASDAAEFVLGVVKNPYSLNLKAGLKSVCLEYPEDGPMLLLNYLWRMSPHIKPNVRTEALSFAKDWRSKLAEQIKDHRFENADERKENIEGVSFLLFLAAYKLAGCFEQDDLFSVYGRRHWCLHATKLLMILGLKSSIPIRQFIGVFVRNEDLVWDVSGEAFQCIKAANMFEGDLPATARLKYRLPVLTEGGTVDKRITQLTKRLAIWRDVERHGLADETCKAFILDLEKKTQTLQELKFARRTNARSSTYRYPVATPVATNTSQPVSSSGPTTNNVAAEDELYAVEKYKRKKLTLSIT